MNAMSPNTAKAVKMGAKILFAFVGSAMIGALIKTERTTVEKFDAYIDEHTVKTVADMQDN